MTSTDDVAFALFRADRRANRAILLATAAAVIAAGSVALSAIALINRPAGSIQRSPESMAVLDSAGRERVFLGLRDGTPTLELVDKAGVKRIRIFAAEGSERDGKGAALEVAHRSGGVAVGAYSGDASKMPAVLISSPSPDDHKNDIRFTGQGSLTDRGRGVSDIMLSATASETHIVHFNSAPQKASLWSVWRDGKVSVPD